MKRNPIIFRIYRGIAAAFFILVIALLILGMTGFYIFTHKPLPQVEGEIVIEGIEYPVKVVRDKWGVPHIYANNRHDLFFASGYVQAQDRLFQMDLLRHVVEGRLAEWFGESALESDRFSRVIGFHRQARRNLEHAPPESVQTLEAFADGVNAFLSRRDRNLPLEYKAVHLEVEPWRAEDTLAIALYIGWGLTNDWKNELLRLGIAGERDEKTAWAVLPRYRASGPDIIPEGAWPAETRSREGEGAYAEPAIKAARVIGSKGIAALFAADRDFRALINGSMAFPMASNSWAVDGSMTASGRAMLANDPHLELTIPSVWYELHLSGAGLDVSGVTFPGIPLVVLGHNRRVAWSATTTQADMDDLFIEEVNPEDRGRCRFRDQWEPFKLEKERILVRDPKTGKTSENVIEVRVSRHSPVISDALDPALGADKALSLSWTGFEVTDAMGAFLDVNLAKDWKSFRLGIQKLGCPVQNWVYADAEGNIGYVAAGLFPVRPRHDGTFPVSGAAGEYEWQGFMPADQVPQFTNPKNHYIVTANNEVAPASRSPFVISTSYGPPYRAARIVELLTAGPAPKFTAEDMAAIQMDAVSLRAKRLLPKMMAVLDQHRTENDDFERAWRHLENWDYTMSVDHCAPTIFAMAWRQMLRLTYEDEMSPELFDLFAQTQSGTNAFDNLVDAGESPLFDDGRTPEREGLDDVIFKAFEEGIHELSGERGLRMSTWTWGSFHRLTLQHPLGQAEEFKGLANFLSVNLRPLPLPGGRNTINNGFYILGKGFDIKVGPSMRHIVDFGDMESASMSYPGGQSGQPFSRHYSDLVADWVQGTGHPMLMSESAIEGARESTLEILPAEGARESTLEILPAQGSMEQSNGRGGSAP